MTTRLSPSCVDNIHSCDHATAKPALLSLEKLVDLILDTTEPLDQVKFYGWVLSDRSHVQHQQALALARAAGRSPETARLWLNGTNDCTCGGKLLLKSRIRFDGELEMAREFGQFIHRDLLAEAGV